MPLKRIASLLSQASNLHRPGNSSWVPSLMHKRPGEMEKILISCPLHCTFKKHNCYYTKDCSSWKKCSAFLWCLQFIDLRPQGTLWYRESFVHFPPYTLSCVSFVFLSYRTYEDKYIYMCVYIYETDKHPLYPCPIQITCIITQANFWIVCVKQFLEQKYISKRCLWLL